MEGIIILGKNIINDIRMMEKKSLDISSIQENKSDLTFFNIDEEEGNETLKALKQTYVTTNYKEETILNLQSTLNSSLEDTSKELKLESYKNYNEALNLACKNYITTATEIIEKSLELNPKDVDILNLRGLLKLLKCDFSKAFESFYTAMCYGNNELSRKYVDILSSDEFKVFLGRYNHFYTAMCYGNNELSRKYVDILSSDEFKVFLGRYNHSIRFINEDLNQESIHILNNIIEEDPDLIEPYVILALLYDKLNNLKKKEHYLEKLVEIDKDNPLFENKVESKSEEEVIANSKPKKKKNIIPYVAIGALVIGMIGYHTHSKNKIEKLNSQLSKKDEKINEIDKQLNETSDKLSETSQKLDETNKTLDESKNQEVLVASEDDLYNKANNLKSNKEYKEAISYFKKVIENGKTKKYISESIYQVALLSEKTNNYDDAIKYYKKYINTYNKEDQYYDDAFYQLGMLYYENDDVENAKKTFYGMKSEVPDSMYNNSKVKEILAK